MTGNIHTLVRADLEGIDQRRVNGLEWIDKRGLLALPAPYNLGDIFGSFEKDEKDAFKLPLSNQRVHELAQSQPGPNLMTRKPDY
jgi:hypothetical protein